MESINRWILLLYIIMERKTSSIKTFFVLAFVFVLTVSTQQNFVSQECQQAEYVRKQMVHYGTEYNVFPMDIAKIVKYSYVNECPLVDMHYNGYINKKQLRVAKLMELWVKLDYSCKNKKSI